MKMDQSIKEQVKDLLLQKDHDRLNDLCEADRRFWQEVRFRLYDIDERVRWSAIEAVAKIMQRWWQAGQEEKVRNYIRTLFWSMTDESGGIGWSAPQAIAEVIVTISELIDPYGSMMIAYSIEEPPLIRGCLWGIGRMGRRITDSVEFFKDKVLAVFESNDTEILGLGAWAIGEVGFQPALQVLEELREMKVSLMKESVRIYIEGSLHEKPLEVWIRNALFKIEQNY
ncbi:MAG: hypothetical protein FJ241_12300 [Nitrospira sp.]|nr:hypothetical protein [Nitrospira sp.]